MLSEMTLKYEKNNFCDAEMLIDYLKDNIYYYLSLLIKDHND